jgi:hypothetical protein
MSSKPICISLPDEQIQFLEENPLYKPSKLLQNKIMELQETSTNFEERLKSLNLQIKRLQEHRDKFIEFLNKKGLMEEFANVNENN